MYYTFIFIYKTELDFIYSPIYIFHKYALVVINNNLYIFFTIQYI